MAGGGLAGHGALKCRRGLVYAIHRGKTALARHSTQGQSVLAGVREPQWGLPRAPQAKLRGGNAPAKTERPSGSQGPLGLPS